MNEIWKPVVGFEGLYDVSSEGRVRSYRREPAPKLLKPGIASNGYPSVVLGRGNTRMVHRLVAEAFHGLCPLGCEVRHRDGDRTNPRADNLRWGTRSENIRDAVRNGTWHSEKRRAHWKRNGKARNKDMLRARRI